MTDWRPHYDPASATLFQVYRKGDRVVALHLGYYQHQRPGSQLVTSWNIMVVQKHPVWTNLSESRVNEALGPATLDVRETRLRSPGQRCWCGTGSALPDMTSSIPTVAKWMLAWQKLSNRGDGGTAIILATPYDDHSEPPVETLREFALDMMPSIDAALGPSSRRTSWRAALKHATGNHMNAAQPLLAHVVFRFGVGGLENGIVNLINHLPRERWRHAIVSLTDVSREFTERISRPDVRYVALGKRPGHLVRDYPRLLREFKALRPAIVHTRNLAALEAVVPAWAAGVPVRIHGEHGWDIQDPDGRRRRYRLMRRLYRPFVNRYIALSQHLAEYLQHQVGVPEDAISQIYNGVDTERFHPGAPAAIAGCPVPPARALVDRQRRPAGSDQGPAEPCAGVHPRAQAAPGRGGAAAPGRRRRRRAAAAGGSAALRRGRARAAWLAGERADVPQFMRGLDCFVLPSRAEGVSNTILEAMATRLPIVATRVGGNAELIESGMSGTLVPSANPDALARAIIAYFHDRALARRHAKAAYHVALTRFSLATMVAAYASIYERALAAAGVRRPARRWRAPLIGRSLRRERAPLPTRHGTPHVRNRRHHRYVGHPSDRSRSSCRG